MKNLYALSLQQIGIVFGVNALGIVILAQIGGRLVGRMSSQTLLMWETAAMAVGGIALLGVVLNGMGLIGLLLALFVVVASASALLGVLQLVIGAVAAPIVGLGGTTTAVPMAAAIAVFGLATRVIATVVLRPNSAQTRSH